MIIQSKYPAYESIQPPNAASNDAASPRSQNFSRQVQVGPDEYQIKPAEKVPEPAQQVIQSPPNQNFIKTPTKSTTSSSLKVSQGSLNGARPLLIPTVTPKSAKKLPDGVVPVPEKREVEKKTEEEKNELPEENFNNRYRNKISDIGAKEDVKKVDEADKENGAHEVFDQHVGGAYDNFGFGELNDPIKNAEKQSFNKQHIDRLGIEGNKVYENEDNQQLEDPEDGKPFQQSP